jgi:DNA-directed RNA polymerase specialized sigma24 family protein
MTNGYVIPVDPAELSNRFAVFDSLIALIENDGELPEEIEASQDDADYEAQIEPLLDRIPAREADLIQLYYIEKKRQADIAEIFGVTQAAISYRLDRGLQRIKFLLSIPNVTEVQLRKDLQVIFRDIDVDILVGMWLTTCQSEVATQLGLTQGRVRHRFFKAVKVLEARAAIEPAYEPYARIFSTIASKKFNILREVKLPQWADRGGDECV